MSVKKQLLCYFFIFLLLVLTPFLFLPNIFKKLILNSAKKEAENQANILQKELTLSMTENQQIADGLAFFFESYTGELTKTLVDNHLKKTFESNKFKEVYGGTAAFIPDKTPLGKYSPYYCRKQNDEGFKLIFEDLSSDKYNYVNQNWYETAIKAEGFSVWSYPYYDHFGGNEFMMTYSSPVKRNEKLIGFVTADILIKDFADELAEYHKENINKKNIKYCFVLTPDGKAIGLPEKEKQPFGFQKDIDDQYSAGSLNIFQNALEDWNSIFKQEPNLAVLKKENFSEIVEELFFQKDPRYRAFIEEDKFTGDKAVYSIMPMQKPCLLLVTVIAESELLPQLKLIQAVLIFIIIIFIALFLVFYLSGKAAEPFEKLVDQTEKFSEGHFDYRIDLENQKSGLFNKPYKEIKKLTNAFNLMGEKLQKSFGDLEDTRQEILLKLLKASEHKDTDTGQHLNRIKGYSSVIARKLGFPDSQVKKLADASMMHDVGKIGIPDSILLKPGKLTDEEFEIMKTHAKVGGDILSGSNSALLQMAEKIANSHHEKWNGKGYPLGLAGEKIPLEARITAVCDIFDALISKRPYKEPWPFEKAMDLIRQEGGVSLDPKIVEIFINSQDEIRKIAES